jgi:hypothetical protein
MHDNLKHRQTCEGAWALLATPNNDLPTGNDGKIGEGR